MAGWQVCKNRMSRAFLSLVSISRRSNRQRRTRSFANDLPVGAREALALNSTGWTHVIISWEATGASALVSAYVNGKPYGRSYTTTLATFGGVGGPRFKVLFGERYGEQQWRRSLFLFLTLCNRSPRGTPDRFFAGFIGQAALYAGSIRLDEAQALFAGNAALGQAPLT